MACRPLTYGFERAIRYLTATSLFVCCHTAFADHDFTIQGSFVCTSKNITMPVEGAVVGIMRDKSWAADPIVTEVQTRPDGSFVAQVKAKNVGKYYAKLFLNDKQGVFLHDWWTSSVREYNSASRGKNESDLVDLGVTEISRNGGQGTPQCAIWQGGRRAWQEYVRATGQRPLIGEHGNYQITMESTDSGIVWTSRDTTHWEMGYTTGGYAKLMPVSDPLNLTYADLFQFYGTNVHEFGHALRQTADGSDNHFYSDATKYFYGHSHALCDSSPPAVRDNAGYGFNEGWSDFWQGTLISVLDNCFTGGVSRTNFDQESAVAADLNLLQSSLGSCAGIAQSSVGDELLRERRRLIFETLAGAGHEKIHSQSEFRSELAKRFPECNFPSPGVQLLATVPFTIGGPNFHALRPAGSINDVVRGMASRTTSLSEQIANADLVAKSATTHVDQEEQIRAMTLPRYLRAQEDIGKSIGQRLEAARQTTPQELMTEAGEARRAADVAEFDKNARMVALGMLMGQRAALASQHLPTYAEDLALIDIEIAAINNGSNRAAAILVNEAAATSSGDEVRRK